MYVQHKDIIHLKAKFPEYFTLKCRKKKKKYILRHLELKNSIDFSTCFQCNNHFLPARN